MILTGCTRIVFLIGSFAIKIPNFTYEHSHFLKGCYASWNKRKYTKGKYVKSIAKTYFSSWFGLICIQERCKQLERPLSDAEVEYFSKITDDIKKENFGYNQKGEIVCLDYGQ